MIKCLNLIHLFFIVVKNRNMGTGELNKNENGLWATVCVIKLKLLMIKEQAAVSPLKTFGKQL